MFSDFSLKALIGLWDEEILGPNPYQQVDETSDTILLNFNGEDLIESPSSQLQVVGKLAENGSLQVSVLGGTIVYGVDNKRK